MVKVEIDPADSSRIVAETAFKHSEMIKKIPGSRYDKNSYTWRLPLSWPACLALRATFGEELEIGPALREWATHELKDRVQPALELRDQLSADLYPDLYDYQNADVLFLTTARQAILGNEPGSGKAQPVSEPVLTPTGLQPIGDLVPGDVVYAIDGSETAVLAVHPQGVRSVYKVTFSDGTFTHADREHLWTIQTHRDRGLNASRMMTTQELSRRLADGQKRLYLPRHAPVRHQYKDFPINPYVLGCLLGDGTLGGKGTRLTSHDDELVEWVAKLCAEDGFQLTYEQTEHTYGIVGVRSHLDLLGLKGVRAHEKFIPQIYMIGAVEQRRALLAGLLDTDGWVAGSGAEFVSVSRQLAHDVADLARSLGLWSRVYRPTKKKYPYKGEVREGQLAYRVYIAVRTTDPCPFLLTRKVDAWVGRRRGGSPVRRVEKIERVHEEDALCIEVAHPEHLYLTRNYIPTHNTASAIRSLLHLSERGENPFPVLVVAPNSVKLTWKAEFAMWWPGVKVNVIKGTASQRRKLLAEKAHCYVINWESLRTHSRLAPYGSVALRRCVACGGAEEITTARCEVHPRELNAIPFKTVIADELHRAKAPASKQSRALGAASVGSEYRWGLTGTPVANSPADLWSLLHWLDPAGYPSKIKFQERFLDLMYNGFGGLMVSGLKATATDEFFKGFDPRFRRMTKEVVLPFLPPIVRETRYIEMTPKQNKAYKQMRDKMLVELDSGELLIAANPMTRVGRLIQFASSFGELTEPDEEGKQKLILTEPSSKISAFIDDLDDFGDQSIVVFAVSRQLINLLSARLTKASISHGLITGDQDEDEREFHKTQFQEGKTKLILCTIAAGGAGITLTKASTAVFLQRSWSKIDMTQALNRCHRLGSEIHESITIVDYVTPDTAELAVIQSLETKAERFEEVVRDKDLLRKVLTTGAL